MRVAISRVTSDPNPIRFEKGEVIICGHRDRQWTDYLWCTAQSGRQGWVPDFYLEMSGEHEGVALREYDGTELTVAVGDRLEALEEAGGWVRCRAATGLVGWVPADNLAEV